ncbi:MAG: hypothetical protein ACKO8I_02645 [Cyanobacteriota bacterium]
MRKEFSWPLAAGALLALALHQPHGLLPVGASSLTPILSLRKVGWWLEALPSEQPPEQPQRGSAERAERSE